MKRVCEEPRRVFLSRLSSLSPLSPSLDRGRRSALSGGTVLFRPITEALLAAAHCSIIHRHPLAPLLHSALCHSVTPRDMRLVRPVLCSFARAGRRLQAQRGAAFRASGSFCADQTRGSSWVPGRKRAVALTPCLANAPTAGPLQAYAKLVLKGKVREDRHQVKALHLLQTVRVVRQLCLALL